MALVAGTVRYITTRRLRRRLERLEWQRVIERDRGRIARDIHDDLGAGLTQITLLSELARRESPHEMEAHLVQISDTARELTQAVDEIVWAVNPRQDTLDGLVNYICQFAQEYLTVAGILCRLDVPGHLPPLPLSADVRHNLFLAVKEALNNIVKHAQAREVRLRLIQEHGRLTLVIEDDGRGLRGPGPPSVAGARVVGPGARQSREPPFGGRRPVLDLERARARHAGRVERGDCVSRQVTNTGDSRAPGAPAYAGRPMDGESIRVSIVEDDARVRGSFSRLVDQSPGFCCVSQHRSAEDALEGLPAVRPDVVLMDINLPGISGVECISALKALLPDAQVGDAHGL